MYTERSLNAAIKAVADMAEEVSLHTSGTASGYTKKSEATGDPVMDMWLGFPGHLRRMRRRGDWERVADLNVESHVSLQGVVTTSRSQRSARQTTLSWERLSEEDADFLEEIALTSPQPDGTVAVVDPDAVQRNLLTAEHSRGRPSPGYQSAATEHLHGVSGAGTMAVGMYKGMRVMCTRGVESGTEISWRHAYYGDRGWPVMPGWPVYFAADTEDTVMGFGRVRLKFHDWDGNVLKSAAGEDGSGMCEADAPDGSAFVSPRLVLTDDVPDLEMLGAARMAYAKFDAEDYRPLGNGCPVYSVVEYSVEPFMPWRDVSIELQEVRAHAYR